MSRRIPEYRESRGGATLLHEMTINPTHAEIDEFYRIFKDDLAAGLRYGDIEKEGKRLHLVNNNQAECGIYLPTKRWFTQQDVTASKRVFKAHKAAFSALKDWNNIEVFKGILQTLKVPKPILMAHLIFAAWKHDNINLDGGGWLPEETLIWQRGDSYFLKDKFSKLYIKGSKNGELVYTEDKRKAKTWKRESAALRWLERQK